MIALLPVHLTKAYVRGHLRTLSDGRAVQVKPYHTKTAAASREDAKTRDLFADIPPAENQYRPAMHPARTTIPRKAVVPFKTLFPQLFQDNPIASDQNVHYNKDEGRTPAPATEGKKMKPISLEGLDASKRKDAINWNKFLTEFEEGWKPHGVGGRAEATTPYGNISLSLSAGPSDYVVFLKRKMQGFSFKENFPEQWDELTKIGFIPWAKPKESSAPAATKETPPETPPEKPATTPATSTSTPPSNGRIYLVVPYAEKDKAKATADKAGTRIRFDGDRKKWYWEGEGELPGALAKWAPEGAAPKAETPKAESVQKHEEERSKLVAMFDADHAQADALYKVYIEILREAVKRTEPKGKKDVWETAKKEFSDREKNAYAHYTDWKTKQASAGQSPLKASDKEIYEDMYGQWAAHKKYGKNL